MTPDDAQAEWARCAPWIQAALDAGGNVERLEDVWAAVETGRAQFWPALDAAVVTQLCSGGQEFNIYLAGGALERLREMLPSLEAFGQAMGCATITILGRRGWERTFLTREAGYAPLAVLLGKRLSHVQGPEDDHHDQSDYGGPAAGPAAGCAVEPGH